jgi:CBS domain-containing protein
MDLTSLRVETLMTTKVITARIDDTIDLADFGMKSARIRHVPVIDDRQRVVGILSDRDILRAFSAVGSEKLIVGAVMSTSVKTIRPEAPARDAVALMLDHKFGCLPVVDDSERLVGVITETDFLRLIHEQLG